MFMPEFLFSIYAVLEAERLLPRADMWRHSTKLVFSEPLSFDGSEMASSASRYYHKGNFFQLNDTECVCINREPEQSRVTS